jgi:isopentenyl-diphosphate delta-isomerase
VTTSSIVSFDDEPLILVDQDDRELGFETKQHCHDGAGILHRAFSVFLFDADGDVLLQQRSDLKRLWPETWSNACCSHPRRGETVDAAVGRRLREELGLATLARYLFKFHYHATYGTLGAEHELCHVYAGRLRGAPAVNPNEIAALRMVAPAVLDRELAERPDLYTPWLKLEWQRIRASHWPEITALVAG